MASAPPAARRMTTAELLALPDDGVRRWLVNGELREQPTEGAYLDPPMTVRNRFHCRVMTRVGKFLDNWLDGRPEPRGEVLTGEAGVRFTEDADNTYGVDVAYVPADVIARQTGDSTIVIGVPTLIAEILSPSSTEEQTNEKVGQYRAAGVPVVWVIDPHDRTVLIYRPGVPTEMVNEQQELTAEPHLPGFRVPVADLFR